MAELFLNINTLISELKRLGEKSLLEDRVLYDETREVFRRSEERVSSNGYQPDG